LSDEILSKIKEDEYTPAQIIFKVINYMCNDIIDDAEIMKDFITHST
jgi:hypothetical protein